MQRFVIPFSLVALSVGAGCGGGATVEAENAPESRDARAAVTVLTVRPEAFEHRFAVQGNVETDRNAAVTPEFSGLVEEILVVEGQRVQAGQALLRLNTDLVDRSEQELRTQLELSTDLFARQERLWAAGIGSEVEYLQLKAAKEGLEKGLATFAEQREMAVVRSPFDGTVDRVFTKRGEMAGPGMPVARVVDLSEMYVRAMVSDHYAGRIGKGLPAEVVVAGVDTVVTEIGRVGSFINPANRTIEITLPLPGKTRFLPNMFANVWLQDFAADSAVVLPSALVQQDVEGRNFVYLVQDGVVRKRVVELGMGSGDEVMVERGLAWNDQVVEKGASRIVDGESVRILEP